MTESLQVEDIAELCRGVPVWLYENRLIDPDINSLDKNVTYEGRLNDGRVVVVSSSACEGIWTDYSVTVYDKSPHEAQSRELGIIKASDNRLTRVKSEDFDSLHQLYDEVVKKHWKWL